MSVTDENYDSTLKVPKAKSPAKQNLDLSDLKRQRGSVKFRLTAFEKYVYKNELLPLNESQRVEFQLRMRTATTIYEQFNDIQSKIEFQVDESDLSVHLEYREEFEDKYYKIMAIAQCLYEKGKDLNGSMCMQPTTSNSASIKLPDIKLPAFDGAYDHWLEFRNSYISMIHKRTDLDSIQKFHYLRSSLTGSASQVISALEFTATNYVHAWELLESRFHNERLLVHNHVKSLFSMQSVNKESPAQIRKLIDTVLRNLRALKTLNEPTDAWDTLIIHLIVSKLDSSTEREWENHKGSIISGSSGDHSKYKLQLDDLLTFLRNCADMLEMISQSNRNSYVKPYTENRVTHEPKKSYYQPQTNHVHSYVTTKSNKTNKDKRVSSHCVMCNGNHALFTCSYFLNLHIKDRCKLVEDKNLCRNCLRAGHSIAECIFGPCKQCQRKHNSLLHVEGTENVNLSSGLTTRTSQRGSNEHVNASLTSTSTTMHSLSNHSVHSNHLADSHSSTVQPVLLSTALVEVADDNNVFHTARALLDNGSQHCFVTEKLCKRLNSILVQSTVQITGVGQSVSHSNHTCDLIMRSKVNDYCKRLKCFVLPRITSSLPSTNIDSHSIHIPDNMVLADPTYGVPSEIDLLLGADVFWELLMDNKMRLPQGPYLQNSMLGWLISGPVYTNKLQSNKIHCNFTQTIDSQLRMFWEIEDVPKSKNILTIDEQKCEDIFTHTTKREEDGRFSVRMPLKESADALGDSLMMAKKRFISLERKLERSPQYKKMYVDFMCEYRDLGHMTRVEEYGQPNYFLPHHGVFRESSTTTKLRVVFDASAATTSNKSLNDIQLIGPALQNSIFSILLRFRENRYVACADVEKMFRQILIQKDQRDLLLVLFRENPSDPIDVYQLNTVTYGTASAPYLSIRCINQLSQECDDDVIAKVIKEDFYVDDLITGHEDRETLLQICEKVSRVLRSGCFPLRKWTFNFDVTTATTKELSVGEHTQNKTLGIGWQNDTDELYFESKTDSASSGVTKREMLSIISQVYDPLGLLAPAVIVAKIMLQKLWLCKLDWDDQVPHDVILSWNRFIDMLQYLPDIRIPRFVRSVYTGHTELHIFTDASQDAYGACAYVRTYDSDESEVVVNLLCAKSKVAPLKAISVPRLELCGALMGARLYKSIIDSSRLIFDKTYFWTDSTIIMGWLRMSPHLLKTFVQNRVTEINELTGDSVWLHVDSKNNPADLVSRGLYLDALVNNNLWWHGPVCLHGPSSVWKKTHSEIDSKILPELKNKVISLPCVNSDALFDFQRFSSFNKLKRVGAYLLRYVNNCRARSGPHKRTGALTVDELAASQCFLTRLAQMQSFPTEYRQLISDSSDKNIKNNRLSGLNLFLDENKLIRVGGRLNNSPRFNFNKKHPILMCGKHRLTILLFIDEHKRLLHASPQLLLSTMREYWWPLGGRNLARKTVHQCTTCTRIKGKTLTPIMGNLPSERLEPGFPFIRAGVDYAGPVFILNRKGRGAKLEKGYICLFICFATRCIHLELVTSLSTNDYILALKRFISRRGKPLEIFSDNGKNLVGAEKEFPILLQNDAQKIIDETAMAGIKLRFIPPYAPHFGGLWEAGVKSCKYHLRRIVGNAHLTYEEFNTVLTQIEAVLNSRPMTPLSADPGDLSPLTPAHFLIGRPLTAPAGEDLTDVPNHRLSRYDRVEKLRQDFWKRWSTEYVSELQRRTKWKTNKEDLSPNTLVLVKEEHLPPLRWRLGRILRVFPGKDGVSRVAEIRTAAGIIRRVFSKICPLPVQHENAETQLEDGTSKAGGMLTVAPTGGAPRQL